jgi:hypothetical protein
MPNIPVIKILFKKNYLAMIRNAVRGELYLFRNLYASVDDVEQDILQEGQVSCATFVSSLLYFQNSIFEYAGKPRWINFNHATVVSTEKDMEKCGWYCIDELREGAVIAWEPIKFEHDGVHSHIGFYVGNHRAVSNMSNESGIPREHDATYDGARKIVRIWWHAALDEA